MKLLHGLPIKIYHFCHCEERCVRRSNLSFNWDFLIKLIDCFAEVRARNDRAQRYFNRTIVKLLLFLALAMPACAKVKTAPVIFPDKTVVQAELARTDLEKSAGLMHRTSLPANGGMLFIFDTESLYTFWMKNTLISLDIIYLSDEGRVQKICANTPPARKNADDKEVARVIGFGKYVLEVSAGFAKAHKLKVGDRLK
ncbi:MAG: DUF192 domain-containing protein, partial [Elusimicrobia bacterium]|nr:DUF192 domain-containing protein [Elusimicrobiota bacterium]